MKMKEFGLTETKSFHFHRIFKNGDGVGGPSDPPEPTMDPPLNQQQQNYRLRMDSRRSQMRVSGGGGLKY